MSVRFLFSIPPLSQFLLRALKSPGGFEAFVSRRDRSLLADPSITEVEELGQRGGKNGGVPHWRAKPRTNLLSAGHALMRG